MPAPGTPPTNPPLGYVSEAAFRGIPEFANAFVNRAGVADDMDDLGTRANASFPRAMFEFLVQANEIFAGRTSVPGIAAIAGKTWTPTDNGADIIETLDLNAYGIQAPSHLWHCNGTLAAYLGGTAMLAKTVSGATNKDAYALINARGGVVGEENFVYAARGLYDLKRYSAANLSGIASTMAFAAFVSVDGWNQANDGVVIASHRAFDRATETGASYRLGFELGLGYASGTTTAAELCLYYRHYTSGDVSTIRIPVTAGPGSIAPPHGREFFVAFTRTATVLNLYFNGLLLGAGDLTGAAASLGTAPEMRLMLGSGWDGTRYLHGSVRNVAVWTGTQPTAANILAYYMVGAGFLPKAEPA